MKLLECGLNRTAGVTFFLATQSNRVEMRGIRFPFENDTLVTGENVLCIRYNKPFT